MALTNTFKIALASATGAIIISSTVLFPLIKDLNKTMTEDNAVHAPIDAESNKTIQTISKDQNGTSSANSGTSSLQENPSIDKSNTIKSTNDPSMLNADTLNSQLLLEDIPHYKRN
jgi:hypothetical protein